MINAIIRLNVSGLAPDLNIQHSHGHTPDRLAKVERGHDE